MFWTPKFSPKHNIMRSQPMSYASNRTSSLSNGMDIKRPIACRYDDDNNNNNNNNNNILYRCDII